MLYARRGFLLLCALQQALAGRVADSFPFALLRAAAHRLRLVILRQTQGFDSSALPSLRLMGAGFDVRHGKTAL